MERYVIGTTIAGSLIVAEVVDRQDGVLTILVPNGPSYVTEFLGHYVIRSGTDPLSGHIRIEVTDDINFEAYSKVPDLDLSKGLFGKYKPNKGSVGSFKFYHKIDEVWEESITGCVKVTITVPRSEVWEIARSFYKDVLIVPAEEGATTQKVIVTLWLNLKDSKYPTNRKVIMENVETKPMTEDTALAGVPENSEIVECCRQVLEETFNDGVLSDIRKEIVHSIDNYAQKARKYATYPESARIVYPALGLCGESGEVAEKIKKVIRDCNGDFKALDKCEIAKELGDVLWYVCNLAWDLGIPMSEVMDINLSKLESRFQRGKLGGSGDNR